MSDLNRLSITGRLGKDPELKYSQSGLAITQMNVAVGRQWKKKDGTWGDAVEWVRVVCWRELAERVAEACRKGTLVYVEGPIATREWEDKNGQKRYTTECNAEKVMPMAGYVKRGPDGETQVSPDEARRNVAAAREAFKDDIEDLPW